MPFGTKGGIDFNRVYDDLIRPALNSARFAVFRADEEMRAGNIRTDMFQELLLADLVVADLSIDNPNVWYELGVRHALRKRGTIQITCRRDHTPFDVLTERSIRYHIKEKSGAVVPDPEYLEVDKQKLAHCAVETISAWYDRKVSPVYHLLRYLDEPDWTSLRVEEAKQFWEEYEAWAARIEVARKGNRPGDILVLADEAPTRVFRIEAYRTAGKALLSLGQFKLALTQYDNALAIRPKDLESRRQQALCLAQLKRPDEARELAEALLNEYPNDPECWGLFGRIEKERWIDFWRRDGSSGDMMFRLAGDEEGILREAIDAYATGFRKDPTNFYSGINAVTLLCLRGYLTGNDESSDVRAEMEGGVRWAVRGALEKNPKNYWARVTLADLDVLTRTEERVADAYRQAVAVADKDWFKLASSRQQLLHLRDLGFRPKEVQRGLEIIERSLSRIVIPWAPRQVFLFAGHMIDAPGRPEPRFPADNEVIAAKAIENKLEELHAGPEDLALCGAACGGDLLFAEACLERGVRLDLRLPCDEPTFVQKSVAFAGDSWVERYFKVKGNEKTRIYLMPDELGPAPKDANPYARNNLWQLYTALSWGPDRVRFVCLWNRHGGDGVGGTQNMVETVQKYAGRVYVLDTKSLW
jgi:tetratricopeptide (TPR) repeat protein